MREYGWTVAVALLALGVFSVVLGEEGSPESPTLRAAVVLTRHGDRSPIKMFPKQASEWPEGPGALTSVGVRQHYELGSYFRDRYMEKHGLVRPHFTRDDVHVRSTGKERTLMSAHSFMLGFYPPQPDAEGEGQSALPHGVQPVPIYSATPATDSLVYAYKNCDQLKKVRKEHKKASKEWARLAAENQDLLELLSNEFGDQFELGDVTAAWNVLKAERIHGRPSLPAFDDEELRDRIKQLAEDTLRFKFATQEMGRMGAANLVVHVKDRFAAILEAQQELPEFELVSGHDGTILALFAAIGYFDYDIPDYAAHVAFELYEPSEGSPYVEVLYNGEPIHFPTCSFKQCLFDEFADIVSNTIALHDWEGACTLGSPLAVGDELLEEAASGVTREGLFA